MAKILGMPMIGNMYQRVVQNPIMTLTAVATCNLEIAEYVQSIGGRAVMTGSHHERASDRCAEALAILEHEDAATYDIIVMIQGDEPMTHPDMITEAVQPMLNDPSILITDLLGEIKSDEEFEDRNCIKVVCDLKGNALYFSREPIPTRANVANLKMHAGQWQRYFGRRIAEVCIGVIGVGRVGSGVIQRLQSFGTPRILANDLKPNHEIDREFKMERVTKEQIYREADVITLHVPLTAQTKGMIRESELRMMKPGTMLINTARGGIISEDDLSAVMKEGLLGGAAVDVFVQEPYAGPLAEIERCLLTSHMGSMSVDCRTRMELEATEEAVRFLLGKPLQGQVPQEEYDVQRDGL